MKNLFFLFFLLQTTHFLSAQNFSKSWLMAFHVCDMGCNGFQDHTVHLAESDDGRIWTALPGHTPYPGSVPDIIVRNQTLYVFTPGKVRRFDQGNGYRDSSPVPVTVTDNGGNPVNFVDPSPILDAQGNIVLFFLNSTGFSGDPAGCNPYPCTKYFDSATEVPGSDGTAFILNSGHRFETTISSGTASDPDIFEGNSGYYLYISKGSSTAAYHSSLLEGTYSSLGLPNEILTHAGGIPSGIYDPQSGTYKTYVHAHAGNTVLIKMLEHTDFNTQISNADIVMSGNIWGLNADAKTESPGVCYNLLATSDTKTEQKNAVIKLIAQKDLYGKTLGWKAETAHMLKLSLYNTLGQKMLTSEQDNYLSAEKLSPGIYLIFAEDNALIHHTQKVRCE